MPSTNLSSSTNSVGRGRLEGRVAVITGTAGGQGRAAAIAFAQEGAIVVGADGDVEGSEETLRLVRVAGGRMTSRHPIDLTDDASVAEWIDSVAAEFGAIDILYANAGATRFSPVGETSFDEWSWVLRHELDIVFLPVRYAWPHLVKRGGNVIPVGSTAGI